MVAGMTPCTVHPSVVIAAMNAGYQIELAGGGYFDPRMMEDAVREIVAKTPPGAGVCINAIYINPRLFNWQMDLVKSLRTNGVGVEGVTIGAGVPSLEVAAALYISPSFSLTVGSMISRNSVSSISRSSLVRRNRSAKSSLLRVHIRLSPSFVNGLVVELEGITLSRISTRQCCPCTPLCDDAPTSSLSPEVDSVGATILNRISPVNGL